MFASFSLFTCTLRWFLDSLLYVATMLYELRHRGLFQFFQDTKQKQKLRSVLISRFYSNRNKPIHVSSGVNTGQTAFLMIWRFLESLAIHTHHGELDVSYLSRTKQNRTR